VLTGGGSLGAVQVGMIAALHERGIEPDLLVGTSVGAINAAFLAGPGRWADRVEELDRLWRGMRRHDVFVLDPRRWVRAATGADSALFSGTPLQQLLSAHLGYSHFDQSQRRLAVTATDLVTGEPLVIDQGPVLDAVAASAAVPGLLPPIDRDGRTLVDGSVGHPGSLAFADQCGVVDIYLLPAGYPCAAAPPRSALAVALTALTLLLHRQLIAEVVAYAGRARLHVAPPLCPLAVSPADFGHAGELIERAHETTSRWLEGADAVERAGGRGDGRRPGRAANLGMHPAHVAGHASAEAQRTEGILT
jgi:NTE family protein